MADGYDPRRAVSRFRLLALCGVLACASSPLNAQFETRLQVSEPTMQSPNSAAVGDFNRDGNADMAIAATYGEVSVFLGNGDGTFRKPYNYEAGTNPGFVVTAAFRNTRNLDLAATNGQFASNNVAVLLGNGDGTFGSAQFYSTPGIVYGIAVGDFNGDGKPDLATVSYVDGGVPVASVFLGNGDGTFQPAINTQTSATPAALAVGDFNGDGRLDLAVAENNVGTSQVQILLGNGDGTFGSGAIYTIGPLINSITAADFRRDGKLDLAVACFLGPGVYLLLGNGNGTFENPVAHAAVGASWVMAADLNGDNKLDLAVAIFGGALEAGASVLLGNGDGTFQPATFYPTGKIANAIAVADFNNDKMPDLVVPDWDNDAFVELLNTGVASFSPTNPVSFATQLVGTTSVARAVTLTNTGATALTISSMQTSGPFTTKSSCGSSVAAGAKCQINVTFSPTSQRQASGLITLHDSASSKPQIIELNGIATVAEVQPGSLKFGTQKVGTKSTPQPVTLTNTGDTAMSVTQITVYELNYTDFLETNNCPSSLPPKSSCTINVTFDPVKKGARTAALYVTDSGGGSPQSVSLSGTGAE
jgi:hypothetical protein